MKSILISLVLIGATATSLNTWKVGQGEVRVTCSMTVGGSFEVTTTAISGSVAPASDGSPALEGNLVVDLRTLDTGIGLRNRHLRESYLEVDKTPGFEIATLSEIHLAGLDARMPEGKGSFTGLLRLHGMSNPVTGPVDVRAAGAGRRVRASFPVDLPAHAIPKPRYLGVGVKDTVHVEVTFELPR
jgi:polyisoprenoid-binding protein YceI